MKPHKKLAKIRKAMQWSQELFAEKIGVSVNTYAKLERGETNLINSNLQLSVGLLGISLADLFHEDGLEQAFVSIGDHNNTYSNNHISSIVNASADIALELKRLQTENKHQQDMLKQKDVEIKHLNTILELVRRKY